MVELLKDKKLRYPLLAWVFGLSGALSGAAFHGFDQWQSYVLGLPCFLIGAVVSGLLTGKVVYATNLYKGISCSCRKEDPSGYWLAVFIMTCLAIYLLFSFKEYLQ